MPIDSKVIVSAR